MIKLTNANIKNSVFVDINLSDSKFEDVNMKRSAITDVSLKDSVLNDVDLSNVEISNSKHDGMTIEGVPVQALFAAYHAQNDGGPSDAG